MLVDDEYSVAKRSMYRDAVPDCRQYFASSQLSD